jgi:hypothetical protein
MQRLFPLVAAGSGPARHLQDIRTVSVGPPEQILGTIENALATPHPSFKAVKVFISYSRADERFKTVLDKLLSSLKRSGLVSVWHDGMQNCRSCQRTASRSAPLRIRIWHILDVARGVRRVAERVVNSGRL